MSWRVLLIRYLSKRAYAQVESWAFALDAQGLQLLVSVGVFHLRTCKLCDDGIVVRALASSHLPRTEGGTEHVIAKHGVVTARRDLTLEGLLGVA